MSNMSKQDNELLNLLKLYNSYTGVPYDLIRSEGYDAWQEGIDEDKNPYLKYKNAYEIWRDGYNAGSTKSPKPNPYPKDSDTYKIWQAGQVGHKEKKTNPYSKHKDLYKPWQEGWWDGQHKFDSVAEIYQAPTKQSDPTKSTRMRK